MLDYFVLLCVVVVLLNLVIVGTGVAYCLVVSYLVVYRASLRVYAIREMRKENDDD